MTLEQLEQLTLQANPRLAMAAAAAEAAQGRAWQEGLYPNPIVDVVGDELGDRTGPSGIWTAMISQELVTANKLALSREAALRAADQAGLAVMSERYNRLAAVRVAFFEVVRLQRRVEVLQFLIALSDKTVETAKQLLKAKEGSQLEVLQFEIERERYATERDAAREQIPAALRQLAAAVGVAQLPCQEVMGTLDGPLPALDLEAVRQVVMAHHPEIRSAQLGVDRAQVLLTRAHAEVKPNITLAGGFTRQGQNRSNDGLFGVRLPVPLWNRNQGNIRAAQAAIAEAQANVLRVENDLSDQVANAFGRYAAAEARIQRIRRMLVPRVNEAFQLAQRAFKAGQGDYLRVLAAQRAVAEIDLELLAAQAELWKAAGELSAWMLEDKLYLR
jgi:cobalt-zinc-cadmium efflux system outer membrane protein